MILLAIGCSHRTAPLALREQLVVDQDRLLIALDDLTARYGCEAVILSTCNRVELYLARVAPDEKGSGIVLPECKSASDTNLETTPDPFSSALIAEFLADFHKLSAAELLPHLYEHHHAAAVRHLFRVVASLDSLIVGEGQIAGQVKRAYELAHARGTVGPLLHPLFQQAHLVAKRVRTETGIARGHVSVSSAAVDYVCQVFDDFHDKTILVIGAGKMGELTLRHLQQLRPQRICVINRSPEKAQELAAQCDGVAVPWEKLDAVLTQADIVLSTTGSPEPIVPLERYEKIQARRKGGPIVILDIAVPRDFDPRIHDGDRTCLFNIDDLKRIREQTLRDRLEHLAPAEAIVEEEQRRFWKEWSRRRHGPVIARLTKDFEAKRQEVVRQLLKRLNGRLTDEDRAEVEGAFRLLQNRFLHGPISALTEETHEGGSHTLLDALRKLFRLQDEKGV